MMNDAILQIIQGLNSGAALILFLLVLSNPKGYNPKANTYLGLFLGAIFIQLFDEYARHFELFVLYPNLGVISIVSLICMPIFLYFGILYYVRPHHTSTWKDLMYYILPICFLLVLLFGLFYFDGLEVLNRDSEQGPIISIYVVLFLLFLVEVCFYVYKGLALLKQHKKNTDQYTASNEDVNLHWLRSFHYVYIFMILSWFLTTIIHLDLMVLTANLIFLAGIFLIAYYSMIQGAVFPEDARESEEIHKFLSEDTKTDSSAPNYNDWKEKLQKYMVSERPYLDNDMNLAKLSDGFGLNMHQLSATINNLIGKNFSNFINEYRIQEAKSILLDAKKTHYTMLQVAYEAGFNSKTVFNTYFKKTLGCTPSKFKKSHLLT